MAKKKDISYKEAMEKLQTIVDQIENEEPDVDELGKLVKEAKDMILLCKKKLRSTEETLDSAFKDFE